MSAQIINSLQVGDKVKFHGRRIEYTITEIHNDYIYINGSCNAVHCLDVYKVGNKPKMLRNKEGSTAEEVARNIFKIGEKAVYQIMGDIWVTVIDIDNKGIVSVSYHDHEVKRFRPHLSSGLWVWEEINSDCYCTLRPYTGAFYEYSD